MIDKNARKAANSPENREHLSDLQTVWRAGQNSNSQYPFESAKCQRKLPKLGIVPDQLGRSIVSGVPPRPPFYVAKPIDAAAIKASIERALKTQAGRDGVSETVADIGGSARLSAK